VTGILPALINSGSMFTFDPGEGSAATRRARSSRPSGALAAADQSLSLLSGSSASTGTACALLARSLVRVGRALAL
jgi:hypothetical protein